MPQEHEHMWTLEVCEMSANLAEKFVLNFKERLLEIRELEMDEDEGDEALSQCVDFFRHDMGLALAAELRRIDEADMGVVFPLFSKRP